MANKTISTIIEYTFIKEIKINPKSRLELMARIEREKDRAKRGVKLMLVTKKSL